MPKTNWSELSPLQLGRYAEYYRAFYHLNRGVLRAEMIDFISSIENIVACLLGFLVLSEYFNLWKAAGIAMVLLSIFMIARADKKTAA